MMDLLNKETLKEQDCIIKIKANSGFMGNLKIINVQMFLKKEKEIILKR